MKLSSVLTHQYMPIQTNLNMYSYQKRSNNHQDFAKPIIKAVTGSCTVKTHEKLFLCFPSQSFPAVYIWHAISAQQIKSCNYTYRDSEAVKVQKLATCFRSVQDLNSSLLAMEQEHYTSFSFHKSILIIREYSGTHKHCQVLVLMALFLFQTHTDTRTCGTHKSHELNNNMEQTASHLQWAEQLS